MGGAPSVAPLGAFLQSHLPRLPSLAWWCFPLMSMFCCLHFLLLLLLQQVRRPGWEQRLPLLQPSMWPRHGINRLLCILHSSLIVVWGCCILYVEGGLRGVFRGSDATAAGSCGIPPYFGVATTSLQRALLLYSFSFFIYDLMYVLLEKDIPGSLHHLGAFCAIAYSFYQDSAGAELVAGLTLGECSTPLLHLRYFARHFASVTDKGKQGYPQGQATAPCSEAASCKMEGGGCKGVGAGSSCVRAPCGLCGVSFGVLNRAAELGFVFVFIIARSVGGTALTAATCRCQSTPLPVKLMASMVCLISYFWIAQILSLVYKNGSAGRGRPKKEA